MTENWRQWEGQAINGIFPLRRFLNSSDHSGVFLTELRAQPITNVALKLVPAIPTLTPAQLAHWSAAAARSHPHLLRLLDWGRCQLAARPFLFVVMEYAEQNLAEILPRRALSADEARDTLIPILDALAFLHARGLVHGQLKPANILVVDDQLKLSGDTVRPAGEATASIARPGVYDPPESRDGSFTAAGDIWSLGVTLVEALTQQPPRWPERESLAPVLPAAFPESWVAIVCSCLNRNPVLRPTIAELQALLGLPPAPALRPAVGPTLAAPVSATAARAHQESPPSQRPPSQPSHGNMQAAAAPVPGSFPARRMLTRLAIMLVVLGAVFSGLQLWNRQLPSRTQSASGARPAPQIPPPSLAPEHPATARTPAAPATRHESLHPPRPAPPHAGPAEPLPLAHESPSVLHEVVPAVPRSARATIHGRIKVIVRVRVDDSGNVVGESLQTPGPSRYFARLATAAAHKWKFAPGTRGWLVRFEFSRDGTSAHAAPTRS